MQWIRKQVEFALTVLGVVMLTGVAVATFQAAMSNEERGNVVDVVAVALFYSLAALVILAVVLAITKWPALMAVAGFTALGFYMASLTTGWSAASVAVYSAATYSAAILAVLLAQRIHGWRVRRSRKRYSCTQAYL